jgi:tetratricopeptide (TPR) repeat protein
LNDHELVKQAAEALRQRNRGQAASIIRDLVTRDVTLGDTWGQITRLAIAIGESDLAHEAAYRYASVDIEDPRRILVAAGQVAETGRLREAMGLLTSHIPPDKADASVHHFLGTVYSQLGQTERAIEHLRTALRLEPTSGATWLALSALKTFENEDSEIDVLEKLQTRMAGLPASVRAPYQYALGKALNDIGDTDLAFTAYYKGANVMKRAVKYQSSRDQKAAVGILDSFDARFFDRPSVSAPSKDGPIFVTGWPRSGTTLVEQILTSHSKVGDGGELNLLPVAAMEVGGFTGPNLDEYASQFDEPGSAWKRIGETYLYLAQQKFGGGGQFVDKSLNTSRTLGLTHLLFPEAPVIWLKRDPLDAAWSCYKTFFPRSLGWSWSFAQIAEFFKMEDKLHEHWIGLFPAKILTVPYEELVSNPQVWIPQILMHCRLENETQVYQPHLHERSVITSSVAQVRQPISTDSIGAALPYSRHMHDFVSNYER